MQRNSSIMANIDTTGSIISCILYERVVSDENRTNPFCIFNIYKTLDCRIPKKSIKDNRNSVGAISDSD